ncbi:MAG: serine--tRNA ligase, partial [Chlamydiales bacterium]|nr:serine--tRNA ligase [Chlamydiales bacterium]
MLDIRLIRQDKEAIEAKLKTKDPLIDLTSILALDERIRVIKTTVEELKASRNHLSKEIGEKKRLKADTADLMEQVAGLGEKISILDQELALLEENFRHQMAHLPNIPRDEIKVAMDPKENVCIKTFGTKREFPFPFKNHVELNERLKL